MTKMSHKMLLVVTLLSLVMGVGLPARAAANQGSSQQDKVKACNNMADKMGLKGDDRRTVSTKLVMSQKDKMNVCKNLADKKNLTETTGGRSSRTA
jgi:hypothetical protein